MSPDTCSSLGELGERQGKFMLPDCLSPHVGYLTGMLARCLGGESTQILLVSTLPLVLWPW